MDGEYLNSDAVFEVLSRASSLHALDTCKCVSNEWKQMISESTFMSRYCQMTNNLFGYFIQASRWSGCKSMFVDLSDENDVGMEVPRFCRILASSNQGLMCVIKDDQWRKQRFYVGKPATRQWRALPNPKLRYHGISVYIIVLRSIPILHYKIVRLSEDHWPARGYVGFNHIRCEIFDSSTFKWKETQTRLTLQFGEFIVRSNPAVRIGNSLYWLTHKNNVVVFHEPNESFEIFPLPQVWDCSDDPTHMRLVNYQGKFGFTYKRRADDVMELWLSDCAIGQNWKMKRDARISSLGSHVNFESMFGFYNAEIACFGGLGEAIFYNLRDCSAHKKVELDINMLHAQEYFEFRSDHEMVDLKGPIIKRRNRNRLHVWMATLLFILTLISSIWLFF